VLLRAIDKIGFKGYEAQLAITAVDLDKELQPPALVSQSEDGQLRVRATDLQDSVTEYEVQMSYDADFDEPASVDVPADGGVFIKATDVPTYVRGRVITDATTVSEFGPVLTIPAE